MPASQSGEPRCLRSLHRTQRAGDPFFDKEETFMRRHLLLVGSAALAVLTVSSLAHAQEPGKLAPLPDKLTPSVEARVGAVEFKNGLPTQKGIEQLLDIQDFQRATQLYQWAIPAIGVMGWHRASIANGKTGETDWVAYDDYVPRQGILTPTNEVSSVMFFQDLEMIVL